MRFMSGREKQMLARVIRMSAWLPLDSNSPCLDLLFANSRKLDAQK